MDLKGRNFLTLKDYTPQEITYLLELSAKYKAEKKAGVQEPVRTGKISRSFLKRRVREHAAPLRWQHMIWVCSAHIWTRAVLRSEKKRVYAIPRACLAECMMVSSTAALVRRSWKSLRNMPVSRFHLFIVLLPFPNPSILPSAAISGSFFAICPDLFCIRFCL